VANPIGEHLVFRVKAEYLAVSMLAVTVTLRLDVVAD
jgi:transcriptional antiterminator Rof (Rho-off)